MIGFFLVVALFSCGRKQYAYFSSGSSSAAQTVISSIEPVVVTAVPSQQPVITSFENQVIEQPTSNEVITTVSAKKAVANVKQVSFLQKIRLVKAELKKVKGTKATMNNESQVTALLLCIFLGLWGVHRFYLGYTFYGFIQLFTAGGYFVWWIIDLIRIINGDLEPINGPYFTTL
jgi:TM2 domain-containing membrane protein YozV